MMRATLRLTEIREPLGGEAHAASLPLLERTAERVVVRHEGARGRPLPGIALPIGSQCLAYYWLAHPYTVHHWLDSAGRTLAFLVNLSGPVTFGDDWVRWRDLVVYVLLVPDRTLGYRVAIGGEEEVPDVPEVIYRHIEAALDAVMKGWPDLVRFLSAHSAALLGGDAPEGA